MDWKYKHPWKARRSRRMQDDIKHNLYWKAFEIPGGHVSVMIKSDRNLTLMWDETVVPLHNAGVTAKEAIDKANSEDI